jgi:lipopolysaccharide export system protein LptA
MHPHICRILLLLLIGLWSSGLEAQTSPRIPEKETEEEQRRVDILYADSTTIIQEDGIYTQKLTGSVELRMDSVFFYCDSAIIEDNQRVWAYGHIIIQQTDTISTFADSLEFDVETQEAILMGDTVILVNGPQQLYTSGLKYDVENKVATYTTGATLFNEDTQLSSKVGYYYVNTKEAFFKDSVVVIDPDFSLRTDTLQFNTDTKVVYFIDSTLITSDTTRIYCESGFYDTENGLAEFTRNAQFQRGDQLGKAKIIRYQQLDTSFILIGNALVTGPKQRAQADTIAYRQGQDVFSLSGNARFSDGPRLVEASQIFYDAASKKYNTKGRSFISDPPQILQANEVDFSEGEGGGYAFGNVIWQDTSANLTIKCLEAYYDQKRDYLKASGGLRGRPLMITLVEGDTMYMSADTLLAVRANYLDSLNRQAADTLQLDSLALDTLGVDSFLVGAAAEKDSLENIALNEEKLDDTLATESVDTILLNRTEGVVPDSLTLDSIALDGQLIEEEEEDTSRFLIAYNDVRIFKSNLQVLSDSLTFHSMDSVFTFFNNPIMWADTTQMSSDTIRILMKNDAIDRVFLEQKAIIINSQNDGFYNQIKGKQITAFFKEDAIDRMLVEGNAESIYYALDESGAYVGVNKTACSEMMVYFKEGEADRIKFLVMPQGSADPMGDVDHNSMRLDGFRWMFEARPKGLDDLFKPREELFSNQ